MKEEAFLVRGYTPADAKTRESITAAETLSVGKHDDSIHKSLRLSR